MFRQPGPPGPPGLARTPARPRSRKPGGRAPAVRSPGQAGCPCLSGGGPGSSSPHSSWGGATRSSAGTGRGGGDTHPWWRWRRRLVGPECHLRSRSCMPGARAAGTAAGLAPGGGRGLRSGPPPPPQAPAPAPPAAGRCGMGRVARYIPGAPRLGPARPRLRRSARPPASPSVQQSFRPATVLHLRNAPKNKPLVAQLAPLPVTHPSARQSQAVAGPSYHPPLTSTANNKDEVTAPTPAATAPPPLPSQHPLSRQLIISTTRRTDPAYSRRMPMGEAKEVSEGYLPPANHLNSTRFTPLLANHVDGSDHPPLRIPHWLALPLSPGGVVCSNHSSCVRLRPHPLLASVARGSRARGLARFPVRYFRAGVWESGWMRPQAFRLPRSQRSGASCPAPSPCAHTGCVISGEGSGSKRFPACGHFFHAIP